ncbi:hypothetical protein SDC9_96841 [bioreactor metagenome]|uniref:Uncharacterized protein n=1 Tax=bioreactor metagenome TaxID=1076179 RepID=A0A645AB15_9ZZZZ
MSRLAQELTILNNANDKDKIKQYFSGQINTSNPIEINKIKTRIIEEYFPLIEDKYKNVSNDEECKKKINKEKAALINYVYNIFLCDKLVRYYDTGNTKPIRSIINARILYNNISNILEEIYEDLVDFINICTYEEKID